MKRVRKPPGARVNILGNCWAIFDIVFRCPGSLPIAALCAADGDLRFWMAGVSALSPTHRRAGTERGAKIGAALSRATGGVVWRRHGRGVRVAMFEVDVGPEQPEAVQHHHGSKYPNPSAGSEFRSSLHRTRPCRKCGGDACPNMLVTIRRASTIAFHMPAHSHQTLVIEDLAGTPTLVCADDWAPSARWPCAGLFIDFAGPLGRQHTHSH